MLSIVSGDRTGEIIGAYSLRYQNRSWTEVNEANEKVAKAPMVCHPAMALKWFCVWLEIGGREGLECEKEFRCLQQH